MWKAIRDQETPDNSSASIPESAKTGKVNGGKCARRATITEDDVRKALSDFDALWDQLFPIEQHRIVQLLVERVEVAPDELIICLRVEGFASLLGELRTNAEGTACPDGKAMGRAGHAKLRTADNKDASEPRKPLQVKNRARAA